MKEKRSTTTMFDILDSTAVSFFQDVQNLENEPFNKSQIAFMMN